MMREVIGRTPIQPALTEARGQIETQVAQGTQAILDQYKAGVAITQVQLQKVDPPAAVIEAFRDVQRAAADKERLRNEAEAYRNDIIPRARGEAERMIQEAQGFRDSQEARAKGEATRFISVLGAYQQAKDITMRRLYLETMEDILRRNPKVIVDDRLQGLVPFLNLSEQSQRPAGRPAPPAGTAPPVLQSTAADGGTAMNRAVIAAVVLLGLLFAAASSLFTVHQTQQVLITQFGQPIRVVREPGLNAKVPFIQTVIGFDRRLLDFDAQGQEVILGDQRRIVVDTFTRYLITDPLRFYQTVGATEAGIRLRLGPIVSSTLRNTLGSETLLAVLSADRARIMGEIRQRVNAEAQSFGIEVQDVRIRRADLPEENTQAILQRMQSERERVAREQRAEGAEQAQRIRAQAERERTVMIAEAQSQAEILRGQGEQTAIRIFADAYRRDPEFFQFTRTLQAMREAFSDGETRLLLSPDSEFFRYFRGIPDVASTAGPAPSAGAAATAGPAPSAGPSPAAGSAPSAGAAPPSPASSTGAAPPASAAPAAGPAPAPAGAAAGGSGPMPAPAPAAPGGPTQSQ